MERLTIKRLFDLNETIAADLMEKYIYPWEVLPEIGDYILKLGESLPEDLFEKRTDNVWVAKSATIAPTAYISGPAIIDEDAQIGHCAYVRYNAIVGKRAVVGNSTELKNVILFNEAQVPHYNYVGDSILGYKAHMGAGAVTSNLKSDKSLVTVKMDNARVQTGLKKFGAAIGDEVEVGCGSVLNPGTIIGKSSNIYPLSSVREYVGENSIYKKQGETALKH